jgi:HSP20 family protein
MRRRSRREIARAAGARKWQPSRYEETIMAQDRTTQTRGASATNDQHSTAATPGSSAASTAGAQTSRSQGQDVARDRQRSIQTSSEQSTGSGLARRSQTTPTGYGLAGSPFGLMRRMAEDMDRLFEDLGFGLPGFALSPTLGTAATPRQRGSTNTFARTGWMPPIETFRRGDKLVVRADLPGLRKEDVSVEIDDGVLTISGERSEEDVEDREGYYHSERSYGQFQRSLALPEGITGESCDATFKDGVLEVTIPVPKQAERSARKVQIK